MDKKLMIHPHDSTVTCVKFLGSDHEYILSVDCGYKPAIYITEWQTMTRIHQVYLPVQKKNQPVQSYHCAYSYKNDLLIIVENYKGQYSFSLWDFKLNNFGLIAVNNEENQDICVGVHVFEDPKSLVFAVAETKTVKYWSFEKYKLELLHRIHIKEEILDTAISSLTQFFLFTTKQGQFYIINKEVNKK